MDNYRPVISEIVCYTQCAKKPKMAFDFIQ